MRILIALAALVLCAPAFADVYNISATMPAPAGAVNCKLYMNGALLGSKPCSATAVSFPAAIPTEGSYAFTYSGATAAGLEGDKSAALTVVIDKKPGTPGSPPGVTVKCRDAAGSDVSCPASITVTTG